MTGEDEDVCPICKSSRYLNPDMKFLVNPECYHKMCESCVDRIFSLGPAPCPYPGCTKTLRKNKFTKQIFEDIGVEKEVNIRHRVNKIFNKREKDFESLKEYNDYLEELEIIVFNLVNGIDVEETESKLQEYESQNRNAILANSLQLKQEEEEFKELQRLEAERRKQSYELAVQEEQEKEEQKKQIDREIQRQLATGSGSAEEIVQRVHEQSRKESEARRKALQEKFSLRATAMRGAAGLNNPRFKERNTPLTPFTPFNGDRQPKYLFSVQDNYFDPLLGDVVEKDNNYKISGFSVKEAQKQALIQAFFGIGCDIQKEKQQQVAWCIIYINPTIASII